jgi:hypothetical protein
LPTRDRGRTGSHHQARESTASAQSGWNQGVHVQSQRFGATGFVRRVPVREDAAFVWDSGGSRP